MSMVWASWASEFCVWPLCPSGTELNTVCEGSFLRVYGQGMWSATYHCLEHHSYPVAGDLSKLHETAV